MRGLGPAVVSLFRLPGLNCSSIQMYVLLSFYLCFITFLYLDLYVLGDNALLSKGSFMQTKHLCVLIHIRIKDEVGTI